MKLDMRQSNGSPPNGVIHIYGQNVIFHESVVHFGIRLQVSLWVIPFHVVKLWKQIIISSSFTTTYGLLLSAQIYVNCHQPAWWCYGPFGRHGERRFLAGDGTYCNNFVFSPPRFMPFHVSMIWFHHWHSHWVETILQERIFNSS
jgi:hypothetical protein